MIFLRFVIIIFFLVQSINISAASIEKNTETQCKKTITKDRLLSGWYSWNPYQFNKEMAGSYYLTGLDIAIVKKLSEKLGVTVEYTLTGWGKHQKDLNDGYRDMAVGATFTQERSEYVYFSTPYRFEENSLFTLVNSDKHIDFKSISALLSQIRSTNYKLGVTKDFVYADSQINLFISDQINNDIIHEYSDEVEALGGLLKGEIDGFITDRVVGSAAILNHKATALVKEVQLYIKSPIHFIFGKKTVPLDLVDKFNHVIKEFVDSTEYKNILKAYLYPVILVQTINSQWFYILGIIGTFSFAISAVAIVARENATLFIACLMAIIPSAGIGIVRDVLINKDEIGLFLTPSYMYYSVLVVLVGFAFIRLLECYNKNFYEDEVMIKFCDSILVLGDALGQASFVVMGVAIAIVARIEPVEIWGTCFAFLAANGGVMLRNLLRKKHQSFYLDNTINSEIFVVWGAIFSVYLKVNSYNSDPVNIRNAVIIVVIGAFLTRLATYYLNVPSLKFRSDSEITIHKKDL